MAKTTQDLKLIQAFHKNGWKMLECEKQNSKEGWVCCFDCFVLWGSFVPIGIWLGTSTFPLEVPATTA